MLKNMRKVKGLALHIQNEMYFLVKLRRKALQTPPRGADPNYPF